MTEGLDLKLLPRGGLVLCAVSGGADSACLLRLLLEAAPGLDYARRVRALQSLPARGRVRQGRGLCPRLCARAWASLRTSGAATWRPSPARTASGQRRRPAALRYDFLERTADERGAAAIATAHTADDNAETMLLNLARGAGLRGLCGIPERRGRIIRPILGLTREEVEALLAERGEEHVEDSTNAADDYARNRIRHRAVPALESVNPEFIRAARRAAALLRRDEEFLDGLARDFVEKHPEGLPCRELCELPLPVSSRALRLASGTSLSEAHVAAALSLARGEGQGSLDPAGS